MKLRKKDIVLIASAALIAVTAFTLAYFTNSDFITNRFSRKQSPDDQKKVSIEVREQFDPPDDPDGEPFRKDVQIANTGTADSYIRVRLEFSSSEIRDISYVSNDSDKDNQSAYIPAAAFPESALPAGWEYRAADGFYYYTEAVAPGDTTESLIRWVKTVFPADWTGATDGYDIYVYSEAVPADDESGSRQDYEDAWK